jgi:hypothetical protein
MMKKLLASSLLAAFLVFSGAALAHPAGQDTSKKPSSTSDKDATKDKKGKKAKPAAKKAPKKDSGASSDSKPSK